MKRISFMLCLLGASISLYSLDLTPFKTDPHWDYQTIIVNGKIVHHSQNWSGGSHVIFQRYEGIRSVLDCYTRPFKILDIGANNGFFGIKTAEDYNAVSVMVDRNRRLGPICEANTNLGTLIYLQKSMTIEDLKKLVQTEHFDCIFAFHVLHHQQDWREWIDLLFQLADNVIIETPSVNDPVNHGERTKELARYVTSLPQGISIGSFSRGKGVFDHMIWFCQNPEGFSSPAQRLGITTETFFNLQGAFPCPKKVKSARLQELIGSDSL